MLPAWRTNSGKSLPVLLPVRAAFNSHGDPGACSSMCEVLFNLFAQRKNRPLGFGAKKTPNVSWNTTTFQSLRCAWRSNQPWSMATGAVSALFTEVVDAHTAPCAMGWPVLLMLDVKV